MKKSTHTFIAKLAVIFLLQTAFCATNCFSQNYLWAKSAGGTSYDYGNSVATDANGNVFVMGYFASPTLVFGTTTLTNAGTDDIFIVKYDAAGNILWAKSAGGTSNDYGYSLSTDANGNVFMTGYFLSTSITFGTTTLTNAGAADIYIVKYDANGNVLWAKSAGGTSNDIGNSVSTDANGNVFVTGNFESPSFSFGATTLNNAGGDDIFIAKYDAAGNVLWAKSAGASSNDYGMSVSADANGNAFITGYFASPSFTFGTTTLTNANNTGSTIDIFIVKYDAAGNVLWATSAGGSPNDAGYGVSTDASGNVFITGYFVSPSITFGTTTLTNAGGKDIYVAKYDAAGNELWAQSAAGISIDAGYNVSTDANGNVFMTGFFQSPTISFGATTLTNADNTGNTADIFIAKYDAAGNVLWGKSAGGTLGDYGRSVSTDANGNAFATGLFDSSTITFGTTTLTNADNTGTTADLFVVKLGTITTGMESFGANEGVSVFPNPSNGIFQLNFGSNQFTNGEMEIYNMLGEKVYSSTINDQTSTIDISSQSGGMYFYCVKEKANIISSGKIIVQ